MEKIPSPFTALEIMEFLQPVFQNHGLPRVGIVISKSVWLSSHEITRDPDLRPQSKPLRDYGIKFTAMAESEKFDLSNTISALGLKADFDTPDFLN